MTNSPKREQVKGPSQDDVQDSLQEIRKQQLHSPILGSSARFVGLIVFAIVWVGLLLQGSNQMFGIQATMHELTVGSGSNVDFGFGGDYLGWGQVSSHEPGSFPEFEFGEIADLIHELITLWHSTVVSWNDTLHSLNFNSNLFSSVINEQKQPGKGFDPDLFVHLEEWLTLKDGDSAVENLDPELLRNLSKAAEKAARLLAENADMKEQEAPIASGKKKAEVKKQQLTGESFGRYGVLSRRYKQIQERASARAKERKKTRELKQQLELQQKQSTLSHSGVVDKSEREFMDGRTNLKLCRRWSRPWTWLRQPGKCVSRKDDRQIEGKNRVEGQTEMVCKMDIDDKKENNGENNMIDNRNKRITTEFDLEKLVALRAELFSINPNYIQEAEQCGLAVDNVGLLRYLDVAYGEMEFKGVRVSEMILDTIAWRTANNITNMDREKLLEAAQWKQAYVHGYDKEGHAVVVFAPTMNDKCPTDLAVNYLVFNLELAIALGEAGKSPTRQKVSQYTFIVDLADIGTMPPLRTVKASFAVMGRHYPMRPHKILLVHGGHMVQWIWRVLEPLIDTRTREKVTLVRDSEEHAVFSDLFEPAQLEKRFKSGESDFLFNPQQYIDEARPHMLGKRLV